MNKQKILIVEDDPIIALNIHSILDAEGYDVCETASTADKAGKFTEKHYPDLILMDGGRGQVNIALKVLNDLGIRIPIPTLG